MPRVLKLTDLDDIRSLKNGSGFLLGHDNKPENQGLYVDYDNPAIMSHL